LVGCSVVSGRPLRSRAVSGVSLDVCVGLGPVLASHAPSPPAAATGRLARAGSGSHSGMELWRSIISVRPSKQPLMVRTFLKVYMELGSYFFVSARTNKRHHHQSCSCVFITAGPCHSVCVCLLLQDLVQSFVRVSNFSDSVCLLLQYRFLCVCLLLQYLLQSCSRVSGTKHTPSRTAL
jgi:hypothetical protein